LILLEGWNKFRDTFAIRQRNEICAVGWFLPCSKSEPKSADLVEGIAEHQEERGLYDGKP